jgi:heterotetrameric sarcosine oxidase delta subunit
MMRIECPWCGPRDQEEFRCGGQAHIARPTDPGALSDREWSAYLFNRDNTCGLHFERWLHLYGCGQWFNLARDTRTHRILAVYAITEPPPELVS